MLSKNNIKFITSLQQKKFRQIHKKFIVEGEKMVHEALLSNFKINQVIATENIGKSYIDQLAPADNLVIVSDNELKKISTLSTPNKIIAIVEIPDYDLNTSDFLNKLVLGFEDIRDPGNLGTIIRTADWFGINTILCSNESVEVYNPKVVQATMGAIFRVKVVYCDLQKVLEDYKNKIPIYGTFIKGVDVFKEILSENGFILFGNESNGLSKQVENFVDKKISIPGFQILDDKTESLNISSSVAVICAEFRRKMNYSKQNER